MGSTLFSHSHFPPCQPDPPYLLLQLLLLGRNSHRYTHSDTLSPGHCVFSSLAGYPQTCGHVRSKAQSQQWERCGSVSCNSCRGQQGTGTPWPLHMPRVLTHQQPDLRNIAALVKNHLTTWHCFSFLTRRAATGVLNANFGAFWDTWWPAVISHRFHSQLLSCQPG